MATIEEVKEEVKDHLVLVRGGIPYVGVTEDFIVKTGFHLDGDLFAMNENGMRVLSKNSIRFVSEENFITRTENLEFGQSSVEDLTRYLKSKGKMPDFVELTVKDGIQVRTTIDISPNTFLGTFQGVVRPLEFAEKKTCRKINDFEKKDVACVDADNLEFSNWTRYIPQKKEEGNCIFVSYNYVIYVFTNKAIKAGEEIISVN